MPTKSSKGRRLAPHLCERCGQEFLGIASEIRRGKKRYCSPACTTAARRKRAPVEFDGDVFYMNPKGYYISDATHRVLHRAIWEKSNGQALPPEHVVHHRDHDRSNNDPANLEAMTRSDHIRLHNRDEGRAVTPCPGSRNGTAKLTEAQVETIKRRIVAGEHYHVIAADLVVTYAAIGCIARGERWRHVLPELPMVGRRRK